TMVVGTGEQSEPDEQSRTAITVTDEVLAAAGADELLGLVEGGLDHRIQELGGNLSGGQRQRVALARALTADPEILVLVEPTTAADAATEARIAEGLTELRRSRQSRATIILTSSPAFLAAADTVIYAPATGPILSGTHSGLLAAEAYRRAVTRRRNRITAPCRSPHAPGR